MNRYILEGRRIIPCPDILQWGMWFEWGDRRVASDTIGESRVSTVFLGLDHSFGTGKPLLFETMIFGGPLDREQWRCSTWEEAEAQHAEALRQVVEYERKEAHDVP